MHQTRRSFLRAGGFMGVAAILSGEISTFAFGQKGTGSRGGFAIPKEVLDDPLNRITREMFTDCLNSQFSFSLGRVKLADMRLIAVNSLNPPDVKGASNINRECFSVTFLGPASLPLGQGTYALSHSKLEKFELFVVPGAGDNTWRRYGADINRLDP